MSTTDPLVTELRTLRHMLGVRADDIATTTGLNTASISNWETGKTGPRLEKFRAYAAAIGFDLQLVPAEEQTGRVALVDEHHLPLLDLTADEIEAIRRALMQRPANAPHVWSALDKLTPLAVDTVPSRPHVDEPRFDRPIVNVPLPA